MAIYVDPGKRSSSSDGNDKSMLSGYRKKLKKRLDDEEQAGVVSDIKNQAKQKAEGKPGQKGDNILTKAAKGVGNFVKDAAIDIKDTTVDTWQQAGDVGRGLLAQKDASNKTKIAQDRALQWQKQFGGATDEQWKDPKFVKQAQDFANETKRLTSISDNTREDLQSMQKVDAKKMAFDSAETALNVGTLGLGAPLKALAKQGVKIGAKALMKDVVKRGGFDAAERFARLNGQEVAKEAAQEVLERTTKSTVKKVAGNAGKDAMVGAAYGVTQTGKNNPDAHLDDYLLNSVFGAGIGAAIPVVGAGVKKGFQAVKGQIQKKAEKVATKATDHTDVNTIMNKAIEEQEGKYGNTLFTRVKNWVGDQVDPFRALAKVDKDYARSQGVKHSEIMAGESLEDLARRSAASEREAAGLFERKHQIVDQASGQVKEVSAKDLVMKYKGDSFAGKEFNNYTNAKFDLEFREKHGGKRIMQNLDDEQLNKFVQDYEAQNADALTDLAVKKKINDMALDYMISSGAISKEEGDVIKSAYKNAVPLERVFPDDLARPQMQGRNVGSIAKQTVVQRLEGGSDIPLSNSFDTMLNRVYKSVSQGNRAKLAQKILERVEQGHIKADILVGAGNKEARLAARDQIREINKGVRYLAKKVVMSTRQAKRMTKVLDELGVGLDGKVAARDAVQHTIDTVAPLMRENAPKTLDDLSNSYKIKDQLLKAYGFGGIKQYGKRVSEKEFSVQQMAADIANGGWKQLREMNPEISEATAKSIASQLLKKPTAVAGKVVTEAGQVTTKGALKRLLNTSESQIRAIQSKIATREPKLAAKLEEVINYKTKIEANRMAKADLKGVVAEMGDDPTTGKQVISGLIDGQPYKMEVPPEIAKAVQGLDQQKLTGVLKALALMKKPFEVAWTGILNPVFAGVSFALYDTPMSIINSPQGFKTLAPKAVLESFKSLKSSSEFQKKLAAEGARPYGGSGASSFIKPDAKALAAQRNILTNLAHHLSNPEKALSALDVWGGKLANMTRTRVARAAYDDAVKRGATEKQAMEAATLAYRTIMPDFDTMSNLTRQLNSVIPFYAASVAGTRSFGKALVRDPLGTGTKALALGIAPTVGITAFSLMQPAGQEFYKDMEQSGRTQTLDDNLVIVLPGAHKDDKTGKWNGIVKIPLAPEFRAINQTTWRETRALMGGDGPGASHVALSLFDTVTGGIRTSENPLISTVKILAGQDPRTGEQIIKGRMADLPKEEQVYDTTSEAGKKLGGLLGTSPIQADKLLGQFGIAGQTVKNGGKPVEATVGNVANRFEGAYSESTQSAFFDAYSPAKARRDKVSAEVTDLIKANRINEARRKAEEYNQTIPGRFTKFFTEQEGSDAYDPAWDEMLAGLRIKTSDEAFKARQDRK